MYTVLINDDNSVTATERQRIMQNSKLVDALRIIVPKTYNDLTISECTAYLEYLTPINHRHNYVELSIEDDNYKDDYLLYKMSIDTDLTSEVGNVELYVHFIQVTMDEDGKVSTPVRQTDSFIIPIIPIANWFAVPDSTLSALDQRLIVIQELIKANADTLTASLDTKLDGIKLDTDAQEIYGTVNGEKYGDGINLDDLGDALTDATVDGLILVNE